VDELVELVEFCAAEDVAGIHAFHLKAYSPELLDRCLLSDPERAAPHLAAAAERAAELGVFLHLPSDSGCRQPFEHLFVRHDGTVRGCCSGLFEPAVFGLVAGTLDQAPHDLWQAPALQQFRRAAAGEAPYPAPCTACAWRVPTLAAHDRPLRVLAS
jgi:hypothetical protein